MCFGGGDSPTAPRQTPAVPVDQITAGTPTVTVSPTVQNNNNTTVPPTKPDASQVDGLGAGLKM